MQFKFTENVRLSIWNTTHHVCVWSEFQFIYSIRTYDVQFGKHFSTFLTLYSGHTWHTIWMRTIWLKVCRVMLQAPPKKYQLSADVFISTVECKQTELRDVCSLHLLTLNSPKNYYMHVVSGRATYSTANLYHCGV